MHRPGGVPECGRSGSLPMPVGWRERLSPALRLLTITTLAGGVACARVAPSAPRLLMAHHALLAIDPGWAHRPAGAPTIALSRLRGVLRSEAGDSTVDDVRFQNHTAALEFSVAFVGDSALFHLDLTAYDLNDQLAYSASDTIEVRRGANAPVQMHDLVYAGADSGVARIQLVPDPIQLLTGDTAVLAVAAESASGQPITVPVRLGWTSRDDSVVTIDSVGHLHAGFSPGSTYVVAVSASGAVDSALIAVQTSGK